MAAQSKGSGPSEGALAKASLKTQLREALHKALGGGAAGALAMVVQVVALMWMRTTINFQHKYGMSTSEALKTLYAQGGVARFYQGMSAALFQAPLSRFGDTASYAGIMALLENFPDLPPWMKTLCASLSAALFRIGITPIDTLKTTLQVEGPSGLSLLYARVEQNGPMTLYSGSLGSSFATLVGHYPWFLTYDALQKVVPKADSGIARQVRSALIGFVCALTSDVVSNSVRVVKTAKQTASEEMSYSATVSKIVATDGIKGLFLRGLGTKIISNGVQAMLFTVVWRYLQEVIERRQAERRKKE